MQAVREPYGRAKRGPPAPLEEVRAVCLLLVHHILGIKDNLRFWELAFFDYHQNRESGRRLFPDRQANEPI